MGAKNEAETKPATVTADFAAGTLFGAVTGVARHIAGDLELAPAEGEDEVQQTIRLLGELAVRAEALIVERDALKRSAASLKGAATRARNETAAIEAAMREGEPRQFGPLKKPFEPHELAELLDASDAVELAFVGRDGVEIEGLRPREIAGRAWRVVGGRVRLQVPDLTVHGPRQGEAPFRLAGYALLADGEPVAFAPRGDVLPIGPNTTMQLKDDVAF